MKDRRKKLRSISYSKLNTEKLIEVSKIICSGLAGFDDSRFEGVVKNFEEVIVRYETLSSQLEKDKEASKVLMAEMRKKGRVELALFGQLMSELNLLSKDANGKDNNTIIFITKHIRRNCKTNDFPDIHAQISKLSLIAYILRRRPFDEYLKKYPSLQITVERLGAVSDELDALNREHYNTFVNDRKLLELKERKVEMIECAKASVWFIDYFYFSDKEGNVNPVAEDINFLLYDLLGDSD
jgi:hypothetical protein